MTTEEMLGILAWGLLLRVCENPSDTEIRKHAYRKAAQMMAHYMELPYGKTSRNDKG
jgi:hypothetical protein